VSDGCSVITYRDGSSALLTDPARSTLTSPRWCPATRVAVLSIGPCVAGLCPEHAERYRRLDGQMAERLRGTSVPIRSRFVLTWLQTPDPPANAPESTLTTPQRPVRLSPRRPRTPGQQPNLL
jgi:hypothetical protein